ncbi:hypothetical protein EYR38_003879 [Pleurotus pulmonarius]|nr:hypothetical protein EYR38_003879 [Pleurotus pulmonarius]
MAFPSQPRALQMPELLHTIFQFSEPEDNYASARVCKTWSNEALAILWRSVMFDVVLDLLGPTTPSAAGDLVFVRCPQPEDWSRFDHYAWRIHHLDVPWQPYHPSVFQHIVSLRSRGILFPNLEALDFNNNGLGNVHLFTHAKLKTLILQSADDVGEPLHTKTLLLHLPLETYHLHTLNLGFLLIPEEVSHSDLALVLQGLPALKTLWLPGDRLVPQIADTLACHPMLECLVSTVVTHANTTTWDVFSTSLEPDSYPSLKQLEIAVPLARAALILSQTHRPRCLVLFAVKCYWSEEFVDSYARFIDVISSHYPKLETLSVENNDVYQDPPNLQQMAFLELRPIMRLSALRQLVLTHPLQLDLDLGQITEIAKALPSIESLFLNESPRILSVPNLTMSALVTLVSLCPKLEVLGLYVNASVTMPPITNDRTLASLRLLSVGRSSIVDARAVARFLKSILPKSCTLCSNTTPHRAPEDYVYSRRWDWVEKKRSTKESRY